MDSAKLIVVSTTIFFLPILAYDFTGNLPLGWAATGAAIEGSQFAPDNGNAWVFSSSSHYLRTAMVTNPASVTWYYATGSTNAWSYEVQASPTEDFASYQVVYGSPTITAKVNPTSVTADLRPAVRNLGSRFYLRWDDTRPSGGAKRYISGISVTGALLVNENNLLATSRTVSECAAGTTYYVRVKAWGQAGWSDWSAVKTVTTAGGGEEPFDPSNPPHNDNLAPKEEWSISASFNNNTLELGWEAVPGANGYIVEYRTNLLSGDWDVKCYTNNPTAISIDINDASSAPVFYRLRAW